ncbi:MAG TPA: hypothetical protein VIU87_01800 [Mycobacterium sp.]
MTAEAYPAIRAAGPANPAHRAGGPGASSSQLSGYYGDIDHSVLR